MDELTLAGPDAPPPTRRLDGAATDLVLRTVAAHADALLRTARRHSLCADDAHDAYQRALEIFLRRAGSLDPATADRWLHVVVKHEAMSLRRERMALVAPEELDVERHQPSPAPSPEDRVLSGERVTRTAEALQRLKPQELRALWLKALGNSYEEICAETGWTYTKVNRCLAEGRKTFLERYAGIEAGEECERWRPTLSAIVDGEARPEQLSEIRPHLRGCGACRATLRELRDSGPRLAAVLPVGALAVPAAGGLPGPGWLSRMADAIVSALHERAAASALKLQALADATGAGKVAAVAASAAVVAGGGAAVVREATPDRAAARPQPAPAGARHAPRAVASAAPTPGAIAMARPSAATAARAGAAASRPPARRRRPPRRVATVRVAGARGGSAAAIEFAPEPAAAMPATSTSSQSQIPRPMNGGEFDP